MMLPFILSDGRMSLFTPMEYLIQEEYFSARCRYIIRSETSLLGDLASMKRSDFLRIPNLGKVSMSETNAFLEQIAGYWLGYTIPSDHDWWKYRKLFDPNVFFILEESGSPLALQWIREDLRHDCLWKIVTDDPEYIEACFRKKGIGRDKIDSCLAAHGFSLGMDLPSEVGEAVKYLSSKTQ
jgi:hypothetical protein